jgi:hypothetical protein
MAMFLKNKETSMVEAGPQSIPKIQALLSKKGAGTVDV